MFAKRLIHAESPEKVLQIIDEADDEATKEEEAEAQENESNAVGALLEVQIQIKAMSHMY